MEKGFKVKIGIIIIALLALGALWQFRDYFPGGEKEVRIIEKSAVDITPVAERQTLAEEVTATRKTGITRAVELISPSVVNISTESEIKVRSPYRQFHDQFFDEFFREFFGPLPEQKFRTQSLGSGFIINKDGYILTNRHVVEGADSIKVTLADGRSFKGTIQGKDTVTDLAIIKIKAKDLPVAKLGASADLEIGEWAIAIGNPFGFEHTVTVGVISATGRSVAAGSGSLKGRKAYHNLIQTDASINPGNSGGPLVNVLGEVIGINVAIATPSGGSVGIGFAVPVDAAKPVIGDLVKYGEVSRAWIGIVMQNLTPEMLKYFDLEKKEGALISDVIKDGPADKAGLKRKDIILQVDGEKIKNTYNLQQKIQTKKIGAKVELLILRNGEKKKISVTTAKRPSEEEPAGKEKITPVETKAYLGIEVSPVTPQLVQRYNLTEEEGVVITDVEPGSPADFAGIARGDVIKEINEKSISSLSDYNEKVKKLEPDKSVLLLLKRRSYTIYITLTPTEKPKK